MDVGQVGAAGNAAAKWRGPGGKTPAWQWIVLLLLLAANLGIKLWLSSDKHLFPADEQYHALVAKNLVAHPLVPTLYDDPALPVDYHHWNEGHIWVHKPPLTTYVMAAAMWIGGANEFAMRLPDAAFSTGAIVLTYLMGLRLLGKRAALLAAGFHAVMGMLMLVAAGILATDHVDSMFVSAMTLAMYFAVREATDETPRAWVVAALGAALGLALLTKWLPAFLVVPVWMAFMPRRNWKAVAWRVAAVVAIGLAIAVPWFVYIHVRFPLEAGWESSYNFRHLFEAMESQHRPWYFYLGDLAQLYSYLVYVPLVWLVVYAVRHVRDRVARGLVIWIVIPYVFFSWAAMRMEGYVLIAAPAIFLAEAWWCDRVLRRIETARTPLRWVGAAVVTGLLLLTVAESAWMVVPGMRRQRWKWMDENHAQELAIAGELRGLQGRLAAQGIQTQRAVLFHVSHPIEAMFYSGLTAYDKLPTQEEITAITAAGRPMLIASPPGWKAPAAIREDARVRVVPVGVAGL